MNKIACVLCCLVMFVSAICSGPASAADDDTQASVYLVFDPETGEFVTVDDAAVAAQHKAQQDQEAIESVVETADGPDESPLAWLIGAALIAILLGGAAWSKRNRQHAA